MAYTSYGVNDALAQKLWSKELAVEARKATEIAPLIGTGTNSIIQEKTEARKGKGDRITIGLRMQLGQDGVTEGEVAEGNGETLTTYSDNLFINELGGVASINSENTIDAQRVSFDMRAEARTAGRLVGRRMSVCFFNQVCGNTATSGTGYPSSTKYTGLNATTAPSAGRVLRPAAVANDQSLGSTNIFDLTLIDKCIEIAKTGGSSGLPAIRPVRMDGMSDVYVMYLHPSQVTSLRTSTSTGQWLDIQKAAMQGGEVTKNPIFTNALGMYANVIIRESEQIPKGVHSSTSALVANTRRAVFLGAQSAAIGWGMGGGEGKYRWNEELYDHKRRLEVSGWAIFGLKKMVFNGTDFATIVVPTYAADAA